MNIHILEQTIDNCMTQINPILADLEQDTLIRVINMMSYLDRPIPGFEDTSLMIQALFDIAPDKTENPVFIAVNTIKAIKEIVHGQPIDSEELLACILDELQDLHRQAA